METYMQRCFDNAFTNIGTYITSYLFPKMVPDRDNSYKGCAQKLASDLKQNFSWIDFTTLVYDDVCGCEAHSWKSVQYNDRHTFVYPHQPNIGNNDDTLNIIVHCAKANPANTNMF